MNGQPLQQGVPPQGAFSQGGPPGGLVGRGGFMFFGPFGGIAAIALLVLTYVLLAIAFWRILKNAGLTPAIALGMLVPVVNVGVALWAAFTEWPILREIDRLKLVVASTGSAAPASGAPAPAPAPSAVAPSVTCMADVPPSAGPAGSAPPAASALGDPGTMPQP